MENPNLLIQEIYSSKHVQKTIEYNGNICELTSLHVNESNELSLCPQSFSFGKINNDNTNSLLEKITSYKSHSSQVKCSCQNTLVNYSLIEENYSSELHPVKELNLYSSLDEEIFSSLINKLSHLKNLNLIASDEKSLLSKFKLIPSHLSLRIELDETILNPELLSILENKHAFVTIRCSKSFPFKIKKKNFTILNFEVNESNFNEAHKIYDELSQKEIFTKVTPQIESATLAQTLLKLEPRYDDFFMKCYPALENAVSPKLKQMLKLKWLNISFKSRQLCSLPFTEVSSNADGSYKPCCWIGDYDLRDDETGNEIKKVWNGNKIKELRNEFISGNLKTCGKKIKEYSCNPSGGIGNQFASYFTNIERPMLKFHWYINGSCNLECQMCTTWQQKEEFAEIEKYFDDLKVNVLPFIGEIEVVGGEPFYQRRTYALIDFMKSANPLCVWNFTSNGQFNFKGKIKEAITGLRLGIFSVSIDSLIPEIFSKIRVNGVLNQTLQFLDELIQFQKSKSPGFKFQININFVIQKDNWREAENIILFAREKGVELYISPLAHLPVFSIYTLEQDERIQCYQYLKMLYNKYHHPNLLTLINNLGKMETENSHAAATL